MAVLMLLVRSGNMFRIGGGFTVSVFLHTIAYTSTHYLVASFLPPPGSDVRPAAPVPGHSPR